MSISKSFRAALALGVVTAPLTLVGCDDAASTPATSPTPAPVGGAAKPAEAAPKAPDAAKPAAPAEKKP